VQLAGNGIDWHVIFPTKEISAITLYSMHDAVNLGKLKHPLEMKLSLAEGC
jgi:hypothetical protein